MISESATFLDPLVAALQKASGYNRNDQVPPAAVVWTDKERQWEPLVARLRPLLPLLTLGQYSPADRTGPAYWLRCVIAGTIAEDVLPPESTPIIYLPGVSRQEMRTVEECPRLLQPLVELQYRGILWTQKNGRDWTVAAFLQSREGGLGIEVGADNATREAMLRALSKLADETVASLEREAPLRAPFFDALLNPDPPRRLLLWLNDSAGYRQRCSSPEWESFRGLCQRDYGFDPQKAGDITGARLLGQRGGNWKLVWRRFEESPWSYPTLPDLLRRARPQSTLPLFSQSDSWPQENEAAETQLRQRLAELGEKYQTDARMEAERLEAENRARRSSVWTALGKSPLARAMEHVASLARETGRALVGETVGELAAAYSEWGWTVDIAVLDALASVERAEDVAAVKSAVLALYRPWLENLTEVFQRAMMAEDVAQIHPHRPLDPPEPGTCLLFSDGLRFDLGRRLAMSLTDRGFTCRVEWRLGALPGITSTAKPAVTPVASQLSAGLGLDTVVAATGAHLTAEVLRHLLAGIGYQLLRGDEMGNPDGLGWTELGDIDAYSHEHGWKVSHHSAAEVRALAGRIEALLGHGWKRVVVLTDHGWLMLPDGLPKADLPEHLTDVRKGRCARVKEFASTDELTMPWYWNGNVRVATPRGIHCYEAGRECDHGGLSPQECVVPVITISSAVSGQGQNVGIESLTWKGLRCTMVIVGDTEGVAVDLRGQAGDRASSLIGAARLPNPDGTVSLLVEDEDRIGQTAFVVVLEGDGKVLAQTDTRVGG